MRTKTLLLTAVLGAAGVVSSMAQVYSVNAVGYVNVTAVRGGYTLLANPLNNGSNKLSEVIPTAPEDAIIYTFDGVALAQRGTYIGGAWQPDGNAVVAPGTGFYLYLVPPVQGEGPTATLTFVGEVPQGNLSQPVAGGGLYSLQASQVPQAGRLQTDLGFVPAEDDTVYQFLSSTQTFKEPAPTYIAPPGPGWTPQEPTIAVAESFFLFRTSPAGTWSREFHVNN